MNLDVMRLIQFYRSPLGGISRRMVREHVLKFAGDVSGKRVLGLGFATPYLRFAVPTAERIVSLMPARQGASVWPREGPSTTVLCDPMEMPLTDASVDLIIAVHAFEFAADSEELMRELWRVAAPDAELIVVVPRRNGLWSSADNNPFGAGHPFSQGQLDRLLRDHSFKPEAFRHALYFLPSERRLLLKFSGALERSGRIFGPALSGVIVAKAKKQLFPAIARRQRAERYVRVPVLAPQPAFEG
ncbi:MAG: methyltransferase domain-containing protein [Hyphomicrobiaceae bacterium]|nr:methyltransferase domain-containing protein [Hyphomicrobiaceae bacterium]